ncbi:MAG: FMN-binding negative transcriptional regulator, partial [Enhydrobacter sp.]
VIEATDEVLAVLTDLAKMYEGKEGWTLDALPPGNAAAQTRGIVAFRMTLTKVEAKTKLSQNRDMEDRTRVIAQLEASEGDDAKATAAWMKKVLP